MLNLRTFLRATALSLVSIAIIAPLATGCGQDVATCSTVCPTGSSADCATACASDQSRCQASNAGGDFQLLLTCLGDANAGSYTAVPELCKAAEAVVASSCTGTSAVDGG